MVFGYYSRSQRQRKRKKIGKLFRELQNNDSLKYIDDETYVNLLENLSKSIYDEDITLISDIFKQYKLTDKQISEIRKMYFDKIKL